MGKIRALTLLFDSQFNLKTTFKNHNTITIKIIANYKPHFQIMLKSIPMDFFKAKQPGPMPNL